MKDNRVVVSVLVKNKQGALVRVSSVFSRRAVNIKQLTVAETSNPEISRITILVTDDGELDHKQIDKQLRKIEYVIDAVILPYEKTISKELLLVKINYCKEKLKEVQEKLFDFSGKIVAFDETSLTGQIVASNGQIDEFLLEMQTFDVVEISRSGVTALGLEDKTFINLR